MFPKPHTKLVAPPFYIWKPKPETLLRYHGQLDSVSLRVKNFQGSISVIVFESHMGSTFKSAVRLLTVDYFEGSCLALLCILHFPFLLHFFLRFHLSPILLSSGFSLILVDLQRRHRSPRIWTMPQTLHIWSHPLLCENFFSIWIFFLKWPFSQLLWLKRAEVNTELKAGRTWRNSSGSVCASWTNF